MGFEPRFIELPDYVNGAMPHQVVAKVVEAMNGGRRSLNGSHIFVAGITYKRDIDDIRESPSLDGGAFCMRQARAFRTRIRTSRS